MIFDQKQKQENREDLTIIVFGGQGVLGRVFHKSKYYESEMSLKCFRSWQNIRMDGMKREWQRKISHKSERLRRTRQCNALWVTMRFSGLFSDCDVKSLKGLYKWVKQIIFILKQCPVLLVENRILDENRTKETS